MVSPAEGRAVLASFRRAVETLDMQALLDVLAPDVVLLADGGGIKQAAIRPMTGATRVARFIFGGSGKHQVQVLGDIITVNGNPALAVQVDGEFDGVMAILAVGGRVAGLYYVRNPEKLTRLAETQPIGGVRPPRS